MFLPQSPVGCKAKEVIEDIRHESYLSKWDVTQLTCGVTKYLLFQGTHSRKDFFHYTHTDSYLQYLSLSTVVLTVLLQHQELTELPEKC